MKTYSRRDFIKASSNTAGGLLLAFHLPVLGKAVPYEPWSDAGSELNAWLAINVDNTITIRVAMSEMGQGAMTALPMIIAEELEADWRLVRVEYADVNRHIRDDHAYGKMLTANSGSVSIPEKCCNQSGPRLVNDSSRQQQNAGWCPMPIVMRITGKSLTGRPETPFPTEN